MSLIMRQLLKYGINLLDKENITQDQVEYVYKKWGSGVAERLVRMLEDETKRARDTLERLKKGGKIPAEDKPRTKRRKHRGRNRALTRRKP